MLSWSGRKPLIPRRHQTSAVITFIIILSLESVKIRDDMNVQAKEDTSIEP